MALFAELNSGLVNAWSVRLPAALSALGCVFALYFWGWYHGRPLAGFLAAVILATFVHDEPVFACAFSPDGKRMAAGGYDHVKGVHYARLWEVATRKELRRFTAGDGRIESLKPVDPSHGLVEALWKIVTQRGRTAARARVELLWRRSPLAAELAAELVMPL